VAPQPQPERSSSRLTINSLIHKMTGQVGREQPSRRGAEGEPRASPVEADYEDTERERVDIPAFLRRQAN
jgi:cell division protein FtsZ